MDNEKKWVELNDELLEVGLLLSEKIFEQLVLESVKDLIAINKNSSRLIKLNKDEF